MQLFSLSGQRRAAHIFISHSWTDKPLARRIARRLRHRGLSVWLDEEQLQSGDDLPLGLQRAIRRATHVIVVATNSSRTSKWVNAEIALARRGRFNKPTIVPLIFDRNLSGWDILDTVVGYDCNVPSKFETTLDALAETFTTKPARRHVSDSDFHVVTEQMAIECPALTPVSQALLDPTGRSTPQFSMLGLSDPELHYLDLLMSSAFDLFKNDRLYRFLDLATSAFRHTGTCQPIIAETIETRKSGASKMWQFMQSLVADDLKPHVADAAIAFFERAPEDSYFAVHHVLVYRGANFSPAQRDKCAQLVLADGGGPSNYRIDAAHELMITPEYRAPAKALFRRWITDGYFDFKSVHKSSESIAILFKQLNRYSDTVEHPTELCEALLQRYKQLLLSMKLPELLEAVSQLHEAACTKYVGLPDLLEATRYALSSTEWDARDNPYIQDLKLALRLLVEAIEDGKLHFDHLNDCLSYLKLAMEGPRGQAVDPSLLPDGELKKWLNFRRR